MSEEKRKEKRQKTKTTLPSLLVVLSCLCFIKALMILWGPIAPTRYYPPPPDPRTSCLRHIRQLFSPMVSYAHEHDGMFPTPSKWCDLLIEYGGVTKHHFKCPSAERGPCNYAMNRNVENIRLGTTKAPRDMVVLFETYPGWNQVGGSEMLTTANHEDKGCNVLFLDGHVAFVRKQDLHKLKWKLDEDQQE